MLSEHLTNIEITDDILITLEMNGTLEKWRKRNYDWISLGDYNYSSVYFSEGNPKIRIYEVSILVSEKGERNLISIPFEKEYIIGDKFDEKRHGSILEYVSKLNKGLLQMRKKRTLGEFDLDGILFKDNESLFSDVVKLVLADRIKTTSAKIIK